MQSLKPWQNDVNRALPKSISRKKSYYLLIFYQGFLPHLWSAVSRNQFGDLDPKRAQSLKKKTNGPRFKMRVSLLYFGRISPASPVTGFPDHYRLWEMSTVQLDTLVDLQGAQPYDDKVDMPWTHGISRVTKTVIFSFHLKVFFLNFLEFWWLDFIWIDQRCEIEQWYIPFLWICLENFGSKRKPGLRFICGLVAQCGCQSDGHHWHRNQDKTRHLKVQALSQNC